MIALRGPNSGELLSFRGRVLLHDGPPAELDFLITNAKPVQLSGSAEQIAQRLGRPVMRLRDHPDLASVRWPLDRRHFRGQ